MVFFHSYPSFNGKKITEQKDPDQKPQIAASDVGLYHLHMSHKKANVDHCNSFIRLCLFRMVFVAIPQL